MKEEEMSMADLKNILFSFQKLNHGYLYRMSIQKKETGKGVDHSGQFETILNRIFELYLKKFQKIVTKDYRSMIIIL